jgi:hypothetical protein
LAIMPFVYARLGPVLQSFPRRTSLARLPIVLEVTLHALDQHLKSGNAVQRSQLRALRHRSRIANVVGSHQVLINAKVQWRCGQGMHAGEAFARKRSVVSGGVPGGAGIQVSVKQRPLAMSRSLLLLLMRRALHPDAFSIDASSLWATPPAAH